VNPAGSTARPSRRWLFAALLLPVLALTALISAPGSYAASTPKTFDVGFADYLYGVADRSNKELNLTESVNADVIRVNMYWSRVAPNEPANPRDLDDPAYDWTESDTAISNATDHGFEVELTVLSAPVWAEGPNRPDLDEAPFGSWKPDAEAFGDFAHAVAQRYSGTYSTGEETLPAVKYFEAWNEGNLSTYITPQWKGKTNLASEIYQALLNNFYTEVKAVNPDAKIVAGATAPYGDPPGGPKRTKPLRFLQELLCLTPKNKKTGCPNGRPSKFDIIAHHPINREDAPTAHALNKGDIEIADFGELTKTLRKAEKLGTPATSGRHEIWADEVWWQTDPPDRDEGVPYKTQARWMEQALYLLWDQGASNVTFLQFRDARYTPGEFTLDSYQTGVYSYDGKRKPSADAIAFPFVTDRKGNKLLAWGSAPESGKLTIETKSDNGGFKKVRTLNVEAGAIFTEKLNLKGNAKLRARVGKQTSLVWNQKD
jgi:hypothetical protein